MTTKARPPRWRSALLFSLGLLIVVFFFAVVRTEARWRVGLDFTNWGFQASESMEFSPNGTRVRSVKTWRLGPITIFSERIWHEPKPRAIRHDRRGFSEGLVPCDRPKPTMTLWFPRRTSGQSLDGFQQVTYTAQFDA